MSRTTTLTDLPQDTMGLIYAHLNDPHSRKAFFSSSRVVRTAPSVLAQISTLHVSREELHQHTAESNPILCFPRGATLRKLVIGSKDRDARNDGPDLARLLDCHNEAGIRPRIEQAISTLNELCLQACILLSNKSTSDFGASLRSSFCPHLRILRLENAARNSRDPVCASAFIDGWAENGGGSNLRELYNDAHITADEIRTLSKFSHLTLLDIKLPYNRSAALIRPLAQLVSLESLSISKTDCMRILGLEDVLTGLKQLKLLFIPDILHQQISALPTSLETLSINHTQDRSLLSSLLSFVKESRLHMLRISELSMSRTDNVEDAAKFGYLLTEFEAARVSVSVGTVGHTTLTFFNAFLGVLEAQMSCVASCLHTVKFSWSDNLEVTEGEELARLIECCPNVTDLHFTECRFPDGFVPIHVLLKLKKLRSLIIEVVDMHDDVLKAGLRVELFELAVLATTTRPGMCPLRIEVADLKDSVEGHQSEMLDSLDEEVGLFEKAWARKRRALLSTLGEKGCEVEIVYRILEFSSLEYLEYLEYLELGALSL